MTSGGAMRITCSCVSLQSTPALQRFAVGPRRRIQLDADPQPLAAHFAHMRAAKRSQLLEEVSAQLGGALDQLLVDQHPQRGARHGAAQRIAAEGAAVIAGLEDAQHFLRRQHRRHRIEAARQRLADDHHVGLHALVL